MVGSQRILHPKEPSVSDPHDPKKTFVVPAPPPNVTGALHIGHALTISIQDTLVRFYRMKGYRNSFRSVAVHPNDERYKHLHGKFVKHPFIQGRKIPIVTDDIIVDMSFGTVPSRSLLLMIQTITKWEKTRFGIHQHLNDDGTLNENAEVSNCRAVKSQGMVITPETNEREFFRWMDNIQDWCISRQLWWGHRCPAYFVEIEGKEQDRSDTSQWVVGRTLEEANERASKLANGAKFSLSQDEDVLDTWFSSGLWPFSIMGWPQETNDMKHYYPNSLLETGWDILFFWVARMILLGVHLTGKIPFKEVFCHAMVRDAHEKLHKKLLEGNLDEKEVQKASQGQKKDYPKDILRVEGYRKFCNKLWNATKFALLKLEGGFQPVQDSKPSGKESLVEKWILFKLNEAAKGVSTHLENRNFMQATTDVYNFWLYELCDVYIEAIKPICDPSNPDEAARTSAQNTLYTALDEGLKLLHPFMPFVTEELWQRLPRRINDQTQTITLAEFPQDLKERDDKKSADAFDDVFSTVKAIRNMADSYNVTNNIEGE
ncbi:hypothetical protein L7F22_007659 [Adiantum nelumboides]|nr:hypothetical protein [Adiantum nelumboides]